ncbi:MAG: NAD(P)-dependent oxidoreductase, partial [Bacteroidetes bacterium QH_1_61_8]
MSTDDGPVYVLIGATGGIGSAVAPRLAGDAQLVLGARTESELKTLAEDTGGDAFPLDATQYD